MFIGVLVASKQWGQSTVNIQSVNITLPISWNYGIAVLAMPRQTYAATPFRNLAGWAGSNTIVLSASADDTNIQWLAIGF